MPPDFVFARCSNPTELWVPLIEKAYAKLHGCYEALSGGLLDDGLVDLTGLVAEKSKLSSTHTGDAFENIWRNIMAYKAEKTLLGCSIEGDVMEGEVLNEDGKRCGLLMGHAYSIIDAIYVKNSAHRKGRHRLLRVRNPWGFKEWNGAWSDNSPELRNNLALVMNEINKLGEDERFDPNNSEDGTFLMCFSDWRRYFNNLFACVDFPDSWSGVRFTGEWTLNNSGGIPGEARESYAKWARNP
jgi:hypothetical protein